MDEKEPIDPEKVAREADDVATADLLEFEASTEAPPPAGDSRVRQASFARDPDAGSLKVAVVEDKGVVRQFAITEDERGAEKLVEVLPNNPHRFVRKHPGWECPCGAIETDPVRVHERKDCTL